MLVNLEHSGLATLIDQLVYVHMCTHMNMWVRASVGPLGVCVLACMWMYVVALTMSWHLSQSQYIRQSPTNERKDWARGLITIFEEIYAFLRSVWCLSADESIYLELGTVGSFHVRSASVLQWPPPICFKCVTFVDIYYTNKNANFQLYVSRAVFEIWPWQIWEKDRFSLRCSILKQS